MNDDRRADSERSSVAWMDVVLEYAFRGEVWVHLFRENIRRHSEGSKRLCCFVNFDHVRLQKNRRDLPSNHNLNSLSPQLLILLRGRRWPGTRPIAILPRLPLDTV